MLFNFAIYGGDMNALEMALEALTNPSTIAVSHAIKLIRAELAKPVNNDYVDIHCPSCLHSFAIVPVAKREWVGLTNEEVQEITKQLVDDAAYCSTHFAIAIEAELRRKNNAV